MLYGHLPNLLVRPRRDGAPPAQHVGGVFRSALDLPEIQRGSEFRRRKAILIRDCRVALRASDSLGGRSILRDYIISLPSRPALRVSVGTDVTTQAEPGVQPVPQARGGRGAAVGRPSSPAPASIRAYESGGV